MHLPKILLLALCSASLGLASQPNVILITVDDLNDWIEPYGGHPQTKTPEMAKFCKGNATTPGAIVFRNAVCAAPVCGPSRSAMMCGYLPHRTGIYNNSTNMLDSPLVRQNPTLPEYFRLHGYHTLSTGKFFHGHESVNGQDYGHWAFDLHEWTPLFDKTDPTKETVSKTNTFKGVVDTTANYPNYSQTKGLSWGPSLDPDFSAQKDYGKATWAKDQLEGSLQEPFFMAVGIYKPHVPWFVAQEFIDLYDEFDSSPGAGDLANLVTPTVLATDLEDINRISNGNDTFSSMKDYDWVVANDAEHNTIKEATRHYLACVSQSDKCLGRIMDALNASAYKDNTIVVIVGDHGWHLGEKLQYHKQTLWAESVLTPMMVRTPSTPASTSYQYCDNPVGLIDLYPTLIDLCGLQPKPDLDGSNFSSMLSNPSLDTGSAAITVSAKGVSVLTKDWHYIEDRPKDNVGNLISKQLYDRNADPMEHNNLNAGNSPSPAALAKMEELDDFAPQTFAANVEVDHGSAPNKDKDLTIKPNRLIADYDQDGYNDLFEQFLGTNGAIARTADPKASAYPKVSLKANGKRAFHYGVSSSFSSFNFTHKLQKSSTLGSWSSHFDATISSEFPGSYEYEFPLTEEKEFVRLELSAAQ
ncbi:MAG: sulfatase [Verrucomicrobiaceae bacterium]